MNKYQEALKRLTKFVDFPTSPQRAFDSSKDEPRKYYIALQELVDKATPKKLKSKTDKDGRLLWVCPNCGDVYMKFWSDVETISCRKHCDECGQALDWSDEDE